MKKSEERVVKGEERIRNKQNERTKRKNLFFRLFCYFRLFRILSSALLISCLILSSISTAQDPASQAEKKPKYEKISSYVIILSISGLKADDLNNSDKYGIRIPTIRSLRENGAYAVAVESVYPSLLNPAHASIATGVYPADHGITSDYPFNEVSGLQSDEPYWLAKDIKTETIWAAAKRGGFVTAAVGYPLTAGADIDFNLPIAFDENYSADIDIVINRSLSKQLINPPDLLDKLGPEIMSIPFSADKKLKDIAGNQRLDQFKIDTAAYIIENQSPNLLLINLDSYAKALKRYGVQSKESMLALEFIDGLLKKILKSAEKLASEPTIFVISDFGFMGVEKTFNPNVALAKKGWLSTGGKGKITSWRAVAQTFGGSAAIFLKDPNDKKSISEIEELFGELYKKPESPIWQILTAQDTAKLGADPRAVIYLDAAPSYTMSSRATGPVISDASERAAHGYLPSRSEMFGTFTVSGKGIKRGAKIEYGRLIDVTPTAARMLGLEMKTARGRVYTEVIDQ
jgi:predicted AlkP superfamily pyrophosphatase or phosphodiesterase